MATNGYRWLQYSIQTAMPVVFPTGGQLLSRPQEFVRRQRQAADFPMLLFQRRLWGPMECSASEKKSVLPVE